MASRVDGGLTPILHVTVYKSGLTESEVIARKHVQVHARGLRKQSIRGVTCFQTFMCPQRFCQCNKPQVNISNIP